jgi:hypothetical protein
VKTSKLAKAADARRHAHQPLQHVELMQTLVQQHSATLAFPRGPPAAARVVRFRAKPIRNNPVDSHDGAELSRLNELTNFRVTRLNTHLEHSSKKLLRMFLRTRNQSLRIRLVRGNRFLNHDVQAGIQSSDA